MGYVYNKKTGFFTRQDIVEEQKRDALKSMALVVLGMLLFLSIVVNVVLVIENKELQKEVEVFAPNYITGVENEI